MSIIRQLPPEQALKIAAGEVIERPANIVKELLENALDAQATHIALDIIKSGKDQIKITDNGIGMSKEDARLCFLPHATSKITSIDELENINSFGFRGEALASISAISKVTLITKQKNEHSGFCIEYTNSKLQKEYDIAHNAGTTLCIQDLFYNVPVRKKFLKQDETEWNQIASLVQAFALSNLNVSFILKHHEKTIFNAPATHNLTERITQLWDFNFAQQFIPLSHAPSTPSWISFQGVISHHHFWRYHKNNIFIFVNNRWIKNPELTKAILKGYYNVLPPGKNPACCIFITVDKTMVDINCHPKKEEVRFIKPNTVETILTNLIKTSLEEHLSKTLSPNTSSPAETHHNKTLSNVPIHIFEHNIQEDPTPTEKPMFTPLPFTPYNAPLHLISKPNNSPIPTKTFLPPQPLSPQIEGKNTQHHSSPKPSFVNPTTIIGQLFNTYILIDHDDELVIIDQHAAHERILYEQYRTKFEHKQGILLLFPLMVKLSPAQLNAIISEQTFFSAQGIELSQIGPEDLAIKTSPPELGEANLQEFITDAALFIQEHETLDRELFRQKLNEHVHSHMACKAAIKAGDKLTLEQMQKLINDLYSTEKRFICIHGRPTLWTIKKNELEKQFRRH